MAQRSITFMGVGYEIISHVCCTLNIKVVVGTLTTQRPGTKVRNKFYNDLPMLKESALIGSGCGTVGREGTSDNRGPGLESSHQQYLLTIYALLTA